MMPAPAEPHPKAMGGVVLSSLSDLARPMMVHGLRRYFEKGIVPLVRNLKGIKLTAKESRAAGVAEIVLNSRLATLAEITDPYSIGSPFERFLENVATRFSKATLMPLWNDWLKLFSSAMTQDRILTAATAFGDAAPTERAYLAFLGIDADMANRIGRQFAEHGETAEGMRIAGTEEWTDPVARRAYRAAINKDVDSTIVTKGIGDVPLWINTPIGRTVAQFKSFALASHQRAFLRGLQAVELGVDGGKAAQLAGLLSATTIGMFIYWLKSVEANRQDDISDNPGRWIAEGLDRSGIFAIMFEVNNTVEKGLGLGAYGALQAMFPTSGQGGKASRYVNRSTAATFTGPTGDFVDTLVRVANGVKRRDPDTGEYEGLSEADVQAVRRLAPGGTLPVVKSIVDYWAVPTAKEAVRD